MTLTGNEAKWAELNQELVHCRDCPRLVAWREQVAQTKRRAFRDWDYWGKPVPGFGDAQAAVLVVGLAPGAHGSNRTGRMFTGDGSGEFLFPSLWRTGFANQPESLRVGDGLQLNGLFINAVCRCAPPDNKPLPEEMRNCRRFLLAEIDLLTGLQGIVALGKIAFDAVLKIYQVGEMSAKDHRFAHGAEINLGENKPWMVASYHPSRQNTQTGRLTQPMFDQIWRRAKEKLV
jgi:uracil-DNA glycosylase family 4